ncbi:hypothetical protein Tsp_05516 [Trichinella spiralis]|uniref:Uncharacterized protein n=1 Tax=Trichinella spiralis TaxID=6334 RepID=E5SSP1_TRISP|nr:hypothetical protein Tsp_05516 [Trichinella spiralis]KRY33111.1 hypothetical protein T01_13366 [Trichinella spiralis]
MATCHYAFCIYIPTLKLTAVTTSGVQTSNTDEYALQKTYVHAKLHSWLAVTYSLQKLISTNSTVEGSASATLDNHKKDNYFRLYINRICDQLCLFDEQNAPLLSVKMLQFPNFDWLFEEWSELNIRVASSVVLTALLASIFYIFLQCRKPKNATSRHRREIFHQECFNGFSTPPYINCQIGKCLCCPKAKQMALGTIVAVHGDLPSNRIIFLKRPVTTSKKNRDAQPKAGSGAETSRLTIA